MLSVDSGVHVSTNEDCRTLLKCYGSAAKNKDISEKRFAIQTENFFDMYEAKDYLGKYSSQGNVSQLSRSNRFAKNSKNDNETKLQARRADEDDEASNDTGYASALEASFSDLHSPADDQAKRNTSFCSINVNSSLYERSNLPVLSRPGHCLHAFIFEAPDEDECRHADNNEKLESSDIAKGLKTNWTNSFVTRVSCTDECLCQCVGESHIFLYNTEQEPICTSDQQWITYVQCESYPATPDRNTIGRPLSHSNIKSKREETLGMDIEYVDSNNPSPLKEQETPTLNGEGESSEKGTSLVDVILATEGWSLLDFKSEQTADNWGPQYKAKKLLKNFVETKKYLCCCCTIL